MKKINIILSGLVILLLSSCSNHVDFGEQYKKIAYIVNSKEKLYYASHTSDKASEGHIAVYCSGSELPGSDIHVRYQIDEKALKTYNKQQFKDQTERYFLTIPAERINFQSSDITIKKGEEYGTLQFTINTVGLDPNNLYVVPITITDGDGCEINKQMNTLFYIILVSNSYDGYYLSEFTRSDQTKGSIEKRLMALTASQVMAPIVPPLNEEVDSEHSHYRITVNADNSVTLSPYLQTYIEQVNDPKGDGSGHYNYYNPDTRTFVLCYKIKNVREDVITVWETLSGY